MSSDFTGQKWNKGLKYIDKISLNSLNSLNEILQENVQLLLI